MGRFQIFETVAMTMSNGQPPPGGGKSYSDKLRTNVNYNQRLKRNVLEISLEKTEDDADLNVGENNMERVMSSLGIDMNLVVGFQTKYRGKFIIMSVWFEPSVNLDRFCKDEKIKVTKGVTTGYIRPAGRPEVVVTVTGLDFKTPDHFVIEYLNKFGNVVNQQPIYCKGKEGFMKDKYNGIRKYQVDFTKSSRQMGSYHFLDGEIVRISYRGNTETCGRCHQVAKNCPGGGKKKECRERGGQYMHISEHMKELWGAIDFVPAGFELPAMEVEDQEKAHGGDVDILETEIFEKKVERQTPQDKDIEKYEGVTISNFPTYLSEAEVLTFLLEKGLPKDIDNRIVQLTRTERNMKVIINEALKPETVQTLLKNIHFHETSEKFWNVPLYCKAIRTLTPVKPVAAPEFIQEQPVETEQVTAQTNPSKEGEVEVKNTIPGMPESDYKKAEQLMKKKKQKESKKLKTLTVEDFDFGNTQVPRTPKKSLSFTDIQGVFDQSKRKTVSPVDSEKPKKLKSTPVKNNQ